MIVISGSTTKVVVYWTKNLIDIARRYIIYCFFLGLNTKSHPKVAILKKKNNQTCRIDYLTQSQKYFIMLCFLVEIVWTFILGVKILICLFEIAFIFIILIITYVYHNKLLYTSNVTYIPTFRIRQYFNLCHRRRIEKIISFIAPFKQFRVTNYFWNMCQHVNGFYK